ncbi:BrnA antitoxin family protein [Parasphaerochaeta coccoides]
MKSVKQAISLRIDADNLEWLKRKVGGYQKRRNAVFGWAWMNGCPHA